jgi:hypothetical protein
MMNKRKSSGTDMEESSQKRRKYRGEELSIDQDLGHNNLTEGTPHCLLQPSENIAHTYSFDIGIPHSHKNIIKESHNSLNSLQ